MRDRIRAYVENLLAPAPACDSKTEILEELISNLTEKYNDLVASGRSPEDAYREVIAGIGDVTEIISFIRASQGEHHSNRGASSERFSSESSSQSGQTNQKNDMGNDDFGSFEQRIRDFSTQIVRECEGPVKEVVNDLKDAAKRFGTSVQQGFRGTNRFRYDYRQPAEGLDSLNIEMRSGDLIIGLSPDEDINIIERSQVDLNEAQRVSFERVGNTLRVVQGRSSVGVVFFGFGIVSSDLEILLPQRVWRELFIHNPCGDIDFSTPLSVRDVSVKNASGDMNLRDLNASNVIVDSASGDLDLIGEFDRLDIRAKSGDATIQGRKLGQVKVEKISGDFELHGDCARLDVKTNSSDVTLKGDQLGQVYIENISGDIELNGSCECVDIKTKSGDATLSGGQLGQVSIDKISGDFELHGALKGLMVKSKSGDSLVDTETLPETLEISTISGDVRLRMPENDGFVLDYKRVSGVLRSDFDVMTSLNNREGSAIYKNATAPRYRISSTSGDIRIQRR